VAVFVASQPTRPAARGDRRIACSPGEGCHRALAPRTWVRAREPCARPAAARLARRSSSSATGRALTGPAHPGRGRANARIVARFAGPTARAVRRCGWAAARRRFGRAERHRRGADDAARLACAAYHVAASMPRPQARPMNQGGFALLDQRADGRCAAGRRARSGSRTRLTIGRRGSMPRGEARAADAGQLVRAWRRRCRARAGRASGRYA